MDVSVWGDYTFNPVCRCASGDHTHISLRGSKEISISVNCPFKGQNTSSIWLNFCLLGIDFPINIQLTAVCRMMCLKDCDKMAACDEQCMVGYMGLSDVITKALGLRTLPEFYF